MFYIWYCFQFGTSSLNSTEYDGKKLHHVSVNRFYISVKRTNLTVKRTGISHIEKLRNGQNKGVLVTRTKSLKWLMEGKKLGLKIIYGGFGRLVKKP